MSNWVIVIELLSTLSLPLQYSDNNQGIKAINNCGSHDHKFCQIWFCRLQAKNLVTSLFFVLLPKCRAQNVDSEKGHGAGKKGMALEKKGMIGAAP